MDKTAIIYMGGTFGCIGSPLSPMPATQFLEKLQCHYQSAYPDLEYLAAPVIKDSSELDACDWLRLVQFIQTLQTEYHNIILIHGTDTLSYAAAFLSYWFHTSNCIVITGSQYPLLGQNGQHLNPQSDAGANLNFALKQIQTLATGVYVAFAENLYSGHSTYKCHTTAYQAFLGEQQSQQRQPDISTQTMLIDEQLLEQAHNIRIHNYYLTPSHPENICQNLQSLCAKPPNILVLQCFGSGNLPYSSTLAQQMNQLLDQGCWVIISSQVLFGELSSKYATGSWLNTLNIVFDRHHSQADLYARSVLLYLQYGHRPDWQQFWV